MRREGTVEDEEKVWKEGEGEVVVVVGEEEIAERAAWKDGAGTENDMGKGRGWMGRKNKNEELLSFGTGGRERGASWRRNGPYCG